MRKNSSEFITHFVSEAGTFRINKDYFAYSEMDDLACYIIADGIDSDEDLNSGEQVVYYLFDKLMTKPSMSKRKLKRYMIEAHKLLNEKSGNIRLKASVTVVLTDYSKMIYAYCGNTRLYHFRKGGMNYRSKDQSMAQYMVDAEKISEDDMGDNEEKNNLTNYMGQSKKFRPFVSKTYKLNDKDAIVLCTVGFWEKIYNVDLINSIKDAKTPSEFVEALEEILLSRQSKVLNNYTVAAIFANKVFKENVNDSFKRKLVKKLATIMIPIILVVGGIFIVNKIGESKARELIVEFEEKGDKYMVDGSYEKAFENYGEAEKNVKKTKDKNGEKRISEKQQVAGLIVDGDEFFIARDFGNAKDRYLKARTQVEFEIDYEKRKLIDILDSKITRTDDFISVYKKSKDGDEEVQRGDKEAKEAKEKEKNGEKIASFETSKKHYNEAIRIYDEAKSLSEDISYYDMKKDMEDKIKEIESKLKESNDGIKEANEAAAKEDKTKDLVKKAEEYKAKGDTKLTLKKYEEANIDYRFALDIYKELSDKYDEDTTEKRSEIERAILESETKLKEMIEAEKEASEKENSED